MSLLEYHTPDGWRFYRYGEDDNGDPLFSFWMLLDADTHVCIYDRSGTHGVWLSTTIDDDEFTANEPTPLLKEIIRGAIDTDTTGVPAERRHDLPDYEQYFFESIAGTIDQTGSIPDELQCFIESVVGYGVEIV